MVKNMEKIGLNSITVVVILASAQIIDAFKMSPNSTNSTLSQEDLEKQCGYNKNFDTLPTFDLFKTASLENMNITSTISKGEIFRAFLQINLKEGTIQNLTVKFSTTHNETSSLEITNVSLNFEGENVKRDPPGVPRGFLTQKNGSTTKDIGTIYLGNVTCRNSSINNNSSLIRIEVKGRLSSKSSKKAGDTFFLPAIIYINNSARIHVIQLSMNISNVTIEENLTTSQDYITTATASYTPNIILTYKNCSLKDNSENCEDFHSLTLVQMDLFNDSIINNTSCQRGEVFRAVLEITMKEAPQQNLTVKFSTLNESKVFDLSYVTLASSGDYVTSEKSNLKTVYSRRIGSVTQDFAKIYLGNVAYQNKSSSTTKASPNPIKIEVVGRLWLNSSKKPGEKFVLSAMVDVNNSACVHVVQLNFTVMNNTDRPDKESPTNETFSANLSLNQTDVRIGDIVNAILVVSVPSASYGDCYIQFHDPHVNKSFSGIFDLINISISNSGRNFGFIHNEPFPTELMSTNNNNQSDKGSLNPRICFNAGITQHVKNFEQGDDDLTISFILRVTDNPFLKNGQKFTVSVGMQFGSYIIIENRDVTILRDGSEMPEFNCSTEILNKKDAGYQFNESIHLSTQCRLKQRTSAEPHNVSFRYYLPHYMTYVEKSINPANYTIRPLDSVVQVELTTPLRFGDFVDFTFKIKVQANKEIDSNAITPWEVAYTIRNMSSNPLTGIHFKEANFVKYKVLGSAAQSPTCLDSLGMNDSNVIKDCAIKAFMSPFGGHEATQARPKGKGWIPHVRDMDFSALRYITVLFDIMKDVNKIEVYASSSDESRATMIDIHRTYDGRAFVLAASKLILNYNGSTNTASALIPGQLRARGVRIVITQTTNDSAKTPFRFELFGCKSSNVLFFTPNFEPCSRRGFDEATEDQIPSEHYHRGYLYHSDVQTLYYCDTVITDKERLKFEPRCFRMKDTGQIKVLGRDVSSIVSIATNDNTLFGVSTDLRGYVTSVDNGTTWRYINSGAWKEAKATLGAEKMLTAITLPWIVNSTFNSIDKGSKCKIGENDWRFCFDGIYVKEQPMVKWNSCCSI